MTDRHTNVKKVLLITLCFNLLAWALKFLWGSWTHSMSMQADSLHSLLDAFSSMLGFVGVCLAAQPPDAEHPYGHSKFETMAAIGISVFIFVGCFEIVSDSVKRFGGGITPTVTPTSFMIMIAMLIGNGMLSRWEGQMGNVLKSEVLLADSLHTKSDVYASLAVIVSMIAIYAGYPLLDPLAALAIAVVIGAAGVKILVASVKVLTDTSQIDSEAVLALAMKVDGVLACHAIRTRGSTTRVYMDLHVHVSPEMTIASAHKLAHQVESAVISQFKEVAEVVVHVEPHLQDLEND
ncbi:MAG: cation transporter [Nitrospirae bacterium]|nr:cation transporter [Candidatus Troglogloeales bacterium]